MAPTLKELFTDISFDEQLANGTVLTVLHKKNDNSLIFQLQLSENVPFSVIYDAADAIKNALDAGKINIYPQYPSDIFTGERIFDIVDFLRREGEGINGYFDDAEVRPCSRWKR